MNMMTFPPRRVAPEAQTWLASLAPLVSPLFPADAAEAFRGYLPLLAALPPAAFNRETLEDAACCARARHGVPSYAELRAVLATWCSEHRPVVPALPKPRDIVPKDERCTPEQAAEILRKYGYVAPSTGAMWPVAQASPMPPPTGETRRQAETRLPATAVPA